MAAITPDRLIQRLESLSPLDPDARTMVGGLIDDGVPHAPGSLLLQQGQPVSGPSVLASGWAWRTRTLPNGRRQVFAIVLPGDFIGLCWRPRPRALASTVAVTPLRTCDAAALSPVMFGRGTVHPGLWEALTLASRHDEMRLLDQVVRLGQQSALERVVSLILELQVRLKAVGLADETGFDLPLTQEHLSSVLGLSLVHVNRTIQQLRKDGLADIGGGRAELRQPERLRALSSFEAMARPYADAV